jgi:hypothetical protein
LRSALNEGVASINRTWGAKRYTLIMGELMVGYCRCSTDAQDLTAQREALLRLGVAPERIYLDYADHRVMPSSVAKPLVGKVIEPCRLA